MDDEKRLLQAELMMHCMLDCIIDKKPIDFSGLSVPRSVIERIQDAINDGRLTGRLEL